MLELTRHHDFQLFLSPSKREKALTNPPSFNWPQSNIDEVYMLELISSHGEFEPQIWQQVTSPFQLDVELPHGEYQWRLTNEHGEISDWFRFVIDQSVSAYLPPTAIQLFDLCEDKSQFLMYFDADIPAVRQASSNYYKIFKTTAELAVDSNDIHYPTHYKRGLEAGKRTAIANVRRWIDRDLMALALLYRIWQEEESGQQAVTLLLTFAQWSPEGPASLLRPCTWGDEVGLSLSRNLFLAYHWLSPLLTESEKDFIRPMLVRIAYQMEERLKEDQFHQFPGHSHTSRLPAYLGVAALALHKEFDRSVCERWLNYSLMIYRGVLPFYGSRDGSWAEGAFYSSSYSKWTHPFFLSVERLSDFSLYNHPFYQNYCQFAMDFVATKQSIHPFGDGFWCQRESVEWPGFFAQNPLRIYAHRFGGEKAIAQSEALEEQVISYDLHLLDVVPTVKQLQYQTDHSHKISVVETNKEDGYHCFYQGAGFGTATFTSLNLLFRASRFGNSSHRHADQGNIALFDNEFNEESAGILIPTGSYGYCFGSQHHHQWTRATQAHNLPLMGGKGQLLDDENATAQLIFQQREEGWYCVQFDLSKAYQDAQSFVRTVVMIAKKGVIIFDDIDLSTSQTLQWRLHSALKGALNDFSVALSDPKKSTTQYYLCQLHSYNSVENEELVKPKLSHGYSEEIPISGGIESDANNDVCHLEWAFHANQQHQVVVSCLKQPMNIHVDNKTMTLDIPQGKWTLDLQSKKIDLN